MDKIQLISLGIVPIDIKDETLDLISEGVSREPSAWYTEPKLVAAIDVETNWDVLSSQKALGDVSRWLRNYTLEEGSNQLTLNWAGKTLAFRNLFSPENRRRIHDFSQRAEGYRRKNIAEMNERINNIRIYQGSIDEVVRNIGRGLTWVETKRPETFFRGENDLVLRLMTFFAGGDAVVNYQSGSGVGTPVKYSR